MSRCLDSRFAANSEGPRPRSARHRCCPTPPPGRPRRRRPPTARPSARGTRPPRAHLGAELREAARRDARRVPLVDERLDAEARRPARVAGAQAARVGVGLRGRRPAVRGVLGVERRLALRAAEIGGAPRGPRPRRSGGASSINRPPPPRLERRTAAAPRPAPAGRTPRMPAAAHRPPPPPSP